MTGDDFRVQGTRSAGRKRVQFNGPDVMGEEGKSLEVNGENREVVSLREEKEHSLGGYLRQQIEEKEAKRREEDDKRR